MSIVEEEEAYVLGGLSFDEYSEQVDLGLLTGTDVIADIKHLLVVIEELTQDAKKLQPNL